LQGEDDGGGGGYPPTIFLANQPFPPFIPTNDGTFPAIVRAEESLLFEIEKAFFDLFAEFYVVL
jgi:hypothetical protein